MAFISLILLRMVDKQGHTNPTINSYMTIIHEAAIAWNAKYT